MTEARTRPSRRQFLHGAGAAVLASGLTACQSSPRRSGWRPRGDRRPNVILLMADQHRADVVGYAGDRAAHTPNIDRLAKQAVRLNRAYCQVPLCAPARQSVLTGQYAHTHGTFRNNAQGFSEDQDTLAHGLASAGYATALFGKTHCNTAGFERVHTLEEMQSEFAVRNPGADRPGAGLYTFDKDDPDYDHLTMMNPDFVRAGDGPNFFMESAVADDTIEYIRSRDDRPFFVWANFVNPHSPLFPPDEFYDLYQDRTLPTFGTMTLDEPGILGIHSRRRVTQGLERVGPSELQNITRAYYASLAWTDSCIGRVLDAVEDEGLWRDTLVIYTSDHGEMLGQHGLIKKWTFYEAAVRVPVVLRAPWLEPGDRDEVVQHVDLTATLTDWLDAPMRVPPVGRSMAGLLGGGGDWDDMALSELPGADRVHWMIRTDRYKYVWHEAAGVALYDLREDPDEENNLAWNRESEAVVADLRARFREMAVRTDWNAGPRI